MTVEEKLRKLKEQEKKLKQKQKELLQKEQLKQLKKFQKYAGIFTADSMKKIDDLFAEVGTEKEFINYLEKDEQGNYSKVTKKVTKKVVEKAINRSIKSISISLDDFE